ncbi:EI24 domain-containing protein [Parablastomonas sp. CN1-191]|uniref:EI24 domain-containing protein n=1 Tax=Parablastomonas sp. CN1-191 TaxID=3400908 RepID=UPI003BF7C40E
MVRALSLALSDLALPGVRRVLAKSLAVTVLVFAVLGGAAWYGLSEGLTAWLGLDSGLSAFVALIATLLALYMLWTAIAFGVMQLYADEVVAAVEAAHYPAAAARAKPLGMGGEALIGLRSAAFALLVNAIALPIALVLLITGVGTIVVFWLANTLVLGRELMQMAWLRHRADMPRAPLGAGQRFVLGGIAAAMLLVPFVNLLAPIVGAAMATHMIHRRGQAAQRA